MPMVKAEYTLRVIIQVGSCNSEATQGELLKLSEDAEGIIRNAIIQDLNWELPSRPKLERIILER